MKKTVLFFLMIILIASCHQEEIPSVSDKPEGNQLIFDLSDEDALQGCIYVKLKEEPTEEVQIRSIGNTDVYKRQRMNSPFYRTSRNPTAAT